MLDKADDSCYSYNMKDELVVRISDPENLDDIEEWLTEHQIPLLQFEIVDVSDVTLYHDVIVTMRFERKQDYILFNLTWMGK